MAVNPNTTNLAVNKDVANKLRALAKANDMTTLDITNQLLEFALSQTKITVQVKSLVLENAPAKKKRS